MLYIRKYEQRDFENVRYTCLNSDEIADEGELAEFVLNTFCDYYLEHEPYNCFVLDCDGRAVGYIICTEDYDSYKEIFDRDYLPRNENLDEGLYKWACESTLLQKKYKSDYPAHLHIDILPEYQRQGWGGKLLEVLFEHLKSKGINGVMLTAGSENVKGGNFYQKYGFEKLEQAGTDIAYGMKLNK